MACDATARLYDVDEDSVVFKKLQKTKRYDQGTITFRARKGKLIDLDKLHESVWATRLSGGTRSGLVSLEVTAVGQLVVTKDGAILKVAGSDSQFILIRSPDEKHAALLGKLQAEAGSDALVRVTGRIDKYAGRWPEVLRNRPTNPRRILVTSFQVNKKL
ncbi:MAG: hypothetical protein IID44_05290 [Planctomycetes bacterium]|nr:hypothetical protein [Planctomycetota bacterium]